MGEYNIYNVCHGGEEMPVVYNRNTCVTCIRVLMQGRLNDGKDLHVCSHREKRINVDLIGINVIKMPIRPTLGIMSIGHNYAAATLTTTRSFTSYPHHIG